ncbi:hypothetical protein T265_09861 [Opisthorchis viverrini]|uniref:Reverse transcriptase domain-containing protein n=1 Tax=Opisthorchis viverrini TaxID=6198 RepID=A0A075A3E7_OPIVI|nr:hypothetical protein T265_09861 [Opisthorchis viverrini]KER21929.1 hypothetical protein T265_09861 [Opisthorchis viverrini]
MFHCRTTMTDLKALFFSNQTKWGSRGAHPGRVGHFSVYATLSWAWKTALCSANDGSAYVTHVPTNAASGAGHILQWKYPFDGAILESVQRHSQSECGKHRGISLTPVVTRLLASIMLRHFKVTREILTREQQAGFRPGLDDFGQFARKYLRLLLLYEDEIDIVFIFPIDEVLV